MKISLIAMLMTAATIALGPTATAAEQMSGVIIPDLISPEAELSSFAVQFYTHFRARIISLAQDPRGPRTHWKWGAHVGQNHDGSIIVVVIRDTEGSRYQNVTRILSSQQHNAVAQAGAAVDRVLQKIADEERKLRASGRR